jgi:hypothetical protein
MKNANAPARPLLTLPLKRGKVVVIPCAERRAREYDDPARVLERRQFSEDGCGACWHHRRRVDGSGHYCDLGVRLWPDATSKTCRWFVQRKPARPTTETT